MANLFNRFSLDCESEATITTRSPIIAMLMSFKVEFMLAIENESCWGPFRVTIATTLYQEFLMLDYRCLETLLGNS